MNQDVQRLGQLCAQGPGGNTNFDRAAPGDLISLAANWRANLEANLVSAVITTAAVRDQLTHLRVRRHAAILALLTRFVPT